MCSARFVRLASGLIGLTDAAQVATHSLRGALFENLVVMEFVKHALNQGRQPRLHFYRDSQGLEVDLLVEDGPAPGQIGLVEIKSGQTYHGGFAQPLHKLAALLGTQVARRMVVYGGHELFTRKGVELVGLPGIGA